MAKSMEETYAGLMNQPALFDESNIPDGLRYYDPQESEEFITSKEIAKMKEAPDGHPEIILPAGKVDIEEEVHFKRYSKRHEHKYTEKELEQIRQSCMCTIVHDYGDNDIYHMSDEDRARNNCLEKIRPRLAGIVRTYNRVDKFIEAMRVVVEAWEIVEEKENFMFTKKEFYQMINEGKIYHTAIQSPRLRGMNKYDIDTIIRYISNPELDPKDLMMNENKDDWYDQFEEGDMYRCKICNWFIKCDFDIKELIDHVIEYHPSIQPELEEIMKQFPPKSDENKPDYDERFNAANKLLDEFVAKYFKDSDQIDMERMLSKEEAQLIMGSRPEMKVKDLNPKLVKGYDQRSITSRKKKKGGKNFRYKQTNLHRLLNKIQNNPDNNPATSYNRSFMVTHSMFEPAEKKHSFWDDIVFDGSWANDDDVFLLNLITREEMLKQPVPGKPYMTYADEEMNRFWQTMTDAGMNVLDLRRKMNMEDTTQTAIDELGKKKENRKMERSILQRITSLNNNPKFKKLADKAEKAINEQFNKD